MKLFGVRGILIATISIPVPVAAAWAQLGVLRAPTWAFQQTEEDAPE
jgi:hypothetical protein